MRLRAKQRSVVGNGSGGVMSLTAVELRCCVWSRGSDGKFQDSCDFHPLFLEALPGCLVEVQGRSHLISIFSGATKPCTSQGSCPGLTWCLHRTYWALPELRVPQSRGQAQA